ncbi:MAG: outer membrane protein transport protein, partial [Acidobacteria bacterium]|nr:outer membrane protein transport protein [Acidobacteriota bacterium]
MARARPGQAPNPARPTPRRWLNCASTWRSGLWSGLVIPWIATMDIWSFDPRVISRNWHVGVSRTPVTKADHRRPPVRGFLILLGGLCLASSQVGAQSNDPIQARIQFNFSNPGARSLGMAGAFTARADDATAVYANPAGLIQLTQPEVSLDTRGWRFTNRVIDGGNQAQIGSSEGIGYSLTDDRAEALSFVSAFYPAKSRRWVAGVFRHEPARFRSEIRSEGTILTPRLSRGFIRPVDGFYDLRIENFGVAVGVRLGKRFSLGATLGQAHFELSSRLERWDKLRSEAANPNLPVDDTSGLRSPFGNAPENIILYWAQEQEGDDDLALVFGLLWQSGRQIEGVSVISAGAVYRQGPEFDFQAGMFGRIAGPGYISRLSPANPPPGCQAATGCEGVFKVPDVTGIGVSVRPGLRWLLAADLNRVEYSDLMDQALNSLGSDQGIVGTRIQPGTFELDDGNEYRAGVEYAWFRERRLPDV